MFFPNEIITEILAFSDYQTWKDKVDLLNQQYHSLYYYHEGWDRALIYIGHNLYVGNWRNNGVYRRINGGVSIESKIYPICVDSKHHKEKIDTDSQIKLPHNY